MLLASSLIPSLVLSGLQTVFSSSTTYITIDGEQTESLGERNKCEKSIKDVEDSQRTRKPPCDLLRTRRSLSRREESVRCDRQGCWSLR